MRVSNLNGIVFPIVYMGRYGGIILSHHQPINHVLVIHNFPLAIQVGLIVWRALISKFNSTCWIWFPLTYASGIGWNLFSTMMRYLFISRSNSSIVFSTSSVRLVGSWPAERLRAIPTGDVPYLDYLSAGIIAQSALFVSIFYGIQIIWERDAGVLTKLLVTPTPSITWPGRRPSPPR